MAFKITNLSIATNHIKAGVVPSVWTYYNEDSDSVVATNYFREARLSTGDLIMVYLPGTYSSAMYRVSAKSTDKFTATATALVGQLYQAADAETVTTGTALYQPISLNNVVSLLVTSAANTTDTFTTSATAGNFITLTKDIDDGVHFILTTATTLPAGLALATNYYTVNSDGKKCQLSLTRGGDAVAITGAGTGVHTATAQKNAFTLKDGFENQRKIIKVKTDGGVDALIVPTNLADGDIITADSALDAMELVFADGKWQLAKNLSVTAS